MPSLYVGLTQSGTMLPEACTVRRKPIDSATAKLLCFPDGDFANLCNIGHMSTLLALRKKFNIDLTGGLPQVPPKVQLVPGDMLLTCEMLPKQRLVGRHEYTQEEIDEAEYRFGLYFVSEFMTDSELDEKMRQCAKARSQPKEPKEPITSFCESIT